MTAKDERMEILEMIESGAISASEGARLLQAIQSDEAMQDDGAMQEDGAIQGYGATPALPELPELPEVEIAAEGLSTPGGEQPAPEGELPAAPQGPVQAARAGLQAEPPDEPSTAAPASDERAAAPPAGDESAGSAGSRPSRRTMTLPAASVRQS